MIKIAICDDEPIIGFELESTLLEQSKTFGQKIEIELFLSGEELCNYLINGTFFDIIFLDIELNNISGIEVGHTIRNKLFNDSTQIIYISSRESYAMKLFRVRPMDFLIKPLTYEKIEEIFKVIIRYMEKSNQYFSFQKSHTVHRILIKEILYFESAKKKIGIITSHEQTFFYGKLTEVYSELKNHDFMNIHKSYLVNYNYIKKFEYDRITMTNNIQLPISQSRRKEMRRLQLEKRKEKYYA